MRTVCKVVRRVTKVWPAGQELSYCVSWSAAPGSVPRLELELRGGAPVEQAQDSGSNP